MAEPQSRRVCVIGAGMVGICSALWLQRRGFQVTIVDPNPPGSGCSFGNAGSFSPASVVPMSMPGVLRHIPQYLTAADTPLVIRWAYLPTLLPWLGKFVRSGRPECVEAQSTALHTLLGPVFACLAPLIQQAGAEHLLRRDGMLYAYRSREALRRDSLAWKLRQRHGIHFEQLSGKKVSEFEPNLSTDYSEAILVPGNGHTIDPQELVQHLSRAAIAAGARSINAAASGFELRDGRLVGVRVGGHVIEADAAVVACGARSRTFAEALGDRIPLDTERGYHLMIRSPEVVPRIPVLDAERKFIATPMGAGLRIAGIVEFAGLHRPPDPRITGRLLRHARSMLPALQRDYADSELSRWMGFRPSLPDSLPVIGFAQGCRDVVYAFGHGHVGMCGAPMTGKLISELLGRGTASIDIAPFSPARFRTRGRFGAA